MSQVPQLDSNQHFKQIIINSPLGVQLLNETTFQKAYEIAIKNFQKIKDSNFYKSIDLHFGVKSKANINYNEQILNKKEEILNHKIKLQMDFLYKFAQANSQQDLYKINNQYQQALKIIQKREKQIDYTDFIPYINIKAQKKWPVYGQIMQDFNRKGIGTLNVKLGYRSPFSYFDKVQFNLQTPINQLKRKNYQVGLTWQNPTQKYGLFYMGYNFSNSSIYKDIDQNIKSIMAGITKGIHRLQIQRSSRTPHLHDNLFQYIKKGYQLPSKKWSLKLNTKLKDTIKVGDIVTGEYSQLISEASIPYLSDTRFMKIQYNYRNHTDIFSISQYFNTHSLKKLLTYSSLQSNFSLGLIANNKEYVSDLVESIDIRGFQQHKKPASIISNFKTSVKLNIYNYPGLSSVRIVPFLYAQMGLSFFKQKQKKSKLPYILGSGGIGIAFAISQFSQIQLVYSLLQLQNRPDREPVNFQVRIGAFD